MVRGGLSVNPTKISACQIQRFSKECLHSEFVQKVYTKGQDFPDIKYTEEYEKKTPIQIISTNTL